MSDDKIVEQDMKDRHDRAMATLYVKATLAALLIVFGTFGFCCKVSASKDDDERKRLNLLVEALEAENRILRIVQEPQ